MPNGWGLAYSGRWRETPPGLYYLSRIDPEHTDVNGLIGLELEGEVGEITLFAKQVQHPQEQPPTMQVRCRC
jgi:hypothetical protein